MVQTISNETCIKARRQSKVKILTNQSSHQVYNIIPKSREWLIDKCVDNATRTTMPGSTYSEERGYMTTTNNSTNQGLVWLCNQRHG
jgi:hypothetical protein